MNRDDLKNIEDATDGAPEPDECPTCRGYGYFTKHGKPSADRRDRKCLDCSGTGTAPQQSNRKRSEER